MSKFTELKNKHHEKLEELKKVKGNHKINKKKIFPIIVILIISIASAVYFIGNHKIELVGEVEATILSHTAEVSGKILEMPVELGQQVKKGDLIAVIDSTNQDYAIEQLELTLAKKNLALSDLQVGDVNSQAENNISIARANYNSANAAYNKANQDYNNALSLYNDGAISKDVLDSTKLKSDSAANSAAAAKAQLDSALSQSNLTSVDLDVAQIESQLSQMRETLEKYTIKAGSDGVVMSKSYLLGDMVSPGYNLVEIASDEEKYLVFYLPKEELNTIEYDQELSVISDEEKSVGIVKYIDVKSEYTPKDLQTAANKNKDSVKIKVLLSPDTTLKPGEEATVIINK